MSDKTSSNIQFKVTEDFIGIRLDKALSAIPEIHTRSRAAKLIQQGFVIANNGPRPKPSHLTSLGEVFEISIPSSDSKQKLNPYPFELDIVFEDDELIVINKPSGLVVHPAAGHENDTLVNALIYHNKNLSMGFNEHRPGIVHRLDKDTSGLIVVAKNDIVHVKLSEQFKEKTAQRVYWAFTFGSPKDPQGTVQSFLGRNPQHRKKMSSLLQTDSENPVGKWAVTHYSRLQQHTSGISLLECRLETGRTHQIRVHLNDLNCPILGDQLYGGLKRSKNLKSVQLRALIKKLNRVALHAKELHFTHPQSGQKVAFMAPLPPELQQFISELKFDSC